MPRCDQAKPALGKSNHWIFERLEKFYEGELIQLYEHAEDYLKLGVVLKDGFTRRETYKAAGYDESQMIKTQLPDIFIDMWNDFKALHNSRGNNVFSALPISYTEINSYFSLIGCRIGEFELNIIKSLDGIALKVFRESSK